MKIKKTKQNPQKRAHKLKFTQELWLAHLNPNIFPFTPSNSCSHLPSCLFAMCFMDMEEGMEGGGGVGGRWLGSKNESVQPIWCLAPQFCLGPFWSHSVSLTIFVEIRACFELRCELKEKETQTWAFSNARIHVKCKMLAKGPSLETVDRTRPPIHLYPQNNLHVHSKY